MDPLSIATSSMALATFAFKASSAIYSGIEATKTVDTTILQLHSEVGALATSLSGIASTFRSAEVQELCASKSQSATLLTGVNPLLEDCERTLECLGAMLEGISGSGKRGKLNQYLRKPKAAVKLHFKEGEIEGVRHQVRSYSSAMQMTLQMVWICLSLDGKKQVEFLGAVLNRQLSDLSSQISSMEQKISSKLALHAQGSSTDIESDGKRQRQNMRDHVRRAEAIFSNASEYAESLSGTLIGDATDVASMTNVFGSVLGIDDEQRGRISKWIPTGDVLTEEEIEEPIEWMDRPSETQDSDAIQNANDKHELNVHNSNNDLERDMFKARVAVAQNKLKAKEFSVAAAQFRACLAHPTSNISWDEAFELVLQLSEAYEGAHEDTKQQKMLLEFLRTSKSRIPEGQTLRLHHILGIAYLDSALYRHLFPSSSELASARKHSEIAVKGRRSLLGSSHDDYHKSLSLLATTCEAQKDLDAADIYTHLLPSAYVNEEWKRLSHYRNLAIATLRKAGYKLDDKKMNKAAWKWALTSGDLTTILFMRRVYQGDADLDIKYMGTTRLQKFCAEGQNERVKVLLEAGADPNVRDIWDSSPMYDAVANSNLETLRLLLSNGALIENGLGKITPLLHASEIGDVNVVRLLLENGADKKARFGKEIPLDRALKKRHREVVLILDPTYKF